MTLKGNLTSPPLRADLNIEEKTENYCTTERELLTTQWVVNNCCYYLLGKPFKVVAGPHAG